MADLVRFLTVTYGKVVLGIKVYILVDHWCMTLCDPTDCSPPGSSVHGILLVKVLEWVVICSSRGSFLHFLCLLYWRQILYH